MREKEYKMETFFYPLFILFFRIYLPPRDDAAEFDEGGVDLAGHEDDREAVLWRKSNKVYGSFFPRNFFPKRKRRKPL
jgi:hypothetical protein